MKFIPFGKRVLVERVKAEEKVGRFYLPENLQEKPAEGIVVELGTYGVDNLPVVLGNRILFGKYAGTEIKIDENTYLILKEEEILGVFVE